MISSARTVAAALFVVLGMGMLSPAHAAVRICQDSIETPFVEGTTREAALKLAMSAWLTAAGSHGAGYASWRLATHKSQLCLKDASGHFRCRVAARPCVISQTPQPGLPMVPPPKPPGQPS